MMAIRDDEFDGRERRKNPRLNVLVTYFLLGEESAKEASITKNISTDGVCIITDRKLAIDDEVSLEIDLYDESPPVTAKGKIVWMREVGAGIASETVDYELGIAFAEISDDAYKRIDDYVSSHRQKNH